MQIKYFISEVYRKNDRLVTADIKRHYHQGCSTPFSFLIMNSLKF